MLRPERCRATRHWLTGVVLALLTACASTLVSPVTASAQGEQGPCVAVAPLATCPPPSPEPPGDQLVLYPPRPDIETLDPGSHRVNVTVTGPSPANVVLELEWAVRPYRTWNYIDTGISDSSGRASLPMCPGGCPQLGRNFRLRVSAGTLLSRSVQVYVVPQISLDVQREGHGVSARLDAWFYVLIDRWHGHFHSQPVFFYRSARRRGPFKLFTVSRLRVAYRHIRADGDAELVASAHLYSPNGGTLFACVRHRFLPYMGLPGVNRWCGGQTLRRTRL